MAECSVQDCTNPSWARSWCKTHYSRWRIHGDPNKTLMPSRRLPLKCEAPCCDASPHVRWKKTIAVCNRHWQYLHRYGQLTPPPSAPLDPLPLCRIRHCRDEVRSRNSGLCEKHYGRLRRGVDVELDKVVIGRYVTSAGYTKVLDRTHPLADAKGVLYEHRRVAFAVNNGRCPCCFWCGADLEWPKAVVDHLDENKANNEPSNLVVACNPCNRARGAVVPFISRMTPDAVGTFIATIDLIRSKSS